MSKETSDTKLSIPSSLELSKRVRDSVAANLFSNRLIRAGLPLNTVNRILAQTPCEEVREMNAEALTMKECPSCGREISPAYLENAYFDYPVFPCQYCNTKLHVSVDQWHFGNIIEEYQ
ncbi:MAG: hypothetical protein KBT82_16170 [Marinobacter sp.]|uniref:hypothetical protein n=1 Tax=Marinobacter sp. TaxID=50741 RepID=UPI001B4577BF|nr:hypothetical protein [Marinobacter sp.]MBQ0746511.1 hypothetical protein [Marinobacter sp.]MBQ0815683.1 hypothetical protein [Marinobacter sp.]